MRRRLARSEAERQLRDAEKHWESELAALRRKADESAEIMEKEKGDLETEWKARSEVLERKLADQREAYEREKHETVASHTRLADTQQIALKERISALEKEKEDLEDRHRLSMATYQDKLRLEMELTMQSMEAEKQNLLTEHVKASALKEREWHRRLEKAQEEKMDAESQVSVAVAEKEKEMSAIITRLGYEKGNGNGK